MKKHALFIFFILLLLATGCKKEEIRVYNTQSTPDLSNPIVQKFTNVVWYKAAGSNNMTESWASWNNIYKPSDYASSLLYRMAWASLTLYRDGTSNMLFLPPFNSSTAIHCKGNWRVSTEEENTIILSTKTPVTSVTGKIKILSIEAKENLSTAKVSIDFGDRLLIVDLANEHWAPDSFNSHPAYASAFEYDWFASRQIQTTPLRIEDFIGAWQVPAGKRRDGNNFLSDGFPMEEVSRATYVEDLLMHTPNILNGIIFNLQKNGKAQLAYPQMLSDWYKGRLQTSKNVVSDARWTVKGNKIHIETDEDLFISTGEGLLGLKPNVPGLIYLGESPEGNHALPIRILPKQFYIIELISRNEEGFWSRITTRTGVFYVFLFKTEFDGDNIINIRPAFEKFKK